MFLKSKYPKMRFYRQEENEDFVDFLSGASEDEADGEDKAQGGRKHPDDNFIPLIAESVANNDQKIKVNVNRDGDIIESIDIECECGCSTKIIIEYE